jgi:hypothetical protein
VGRSAAARLGSGHGRRAVVALLWLLGASAAAGCRAAAPEAHLAGRFESGRYATPDGAWSVGTPFARTHPLMTLNDGVDDTGGWFFHWTSLHDTHADVWVAKVGSIAELGGIEKLAAAGLAAREREAKEKGASLRVLHRCAIEVQGKPGFRCVYELVQPPEHDTWLGMKVATFTSIVIEDHVDWDDRAMVRFSSAHVTCSDGERPDSTADTATERAKATLESLETTFRAAHDLGG